MNPANSLQTSSSNVRANYLSVLDRINTAARRAGRKPGEIRLIGVTKYVDSAVTRHLVEAGCRDLGESRPQVIWDKSAVLADLEINWHLIGHLQRNKAKRTLPLLTAMHSLDSERLLQQVEQDVGPRENPLDLLLEVNISGDPDKTGLSVVEGEQLLEKWLVRREKFPTLKIVGLMGMGSLQGGQDQARTDFEVLRNLRDRWAVRFGLPLNELSMGMSDDFEIAIEQGATMVRIGSILFANATSSSAAG
ncbi:MAG: YggS family pyridoxal phosphate-dependent enzyme [Planctomycetota bacterium]|nr:YggS family pyridoxal phosphate-dependent enzyme [Planctomycetota bacterium]